MAAGITSINAPLSTVARFPIFFRKAANLAIRLLMPVTKVQAGLAYSIAFLNSVVLACYILYSFALKFGHMDNFFANPVFSMYDGGNAEILGYCLEAMTVTIFALMGVRLRQLLWIAFAGIFIIVMFDDMLGFHEAIGSLLNIHLNAKNYIGEAAGFSVLGIFVAGLWVAGFMARPKNDPSQRMAYVIITGYLGLLIFFGVGVDALHAYLMEYYHVSDTAFTLLEDGAELILTSLVAATALGLWFRSTRQDA